MLEKDWGVLPIEGGVSQSLLALSSLCRVSFCHSVVTVLSYDPEGRVSPRPIGHEGLQTS